MGTVEGSQITVFTLSIPILKHQWGLEDYHSSIQASLIFVGFLIGAMISGQVADRLGRKLPFLYSSFVILSLSVLTAAAQNIIQLIIIRFILGTTSKPRAYPPPLNARHLSLYLTLSYHFSWFFRASCDVDNYWNNSCRLAWSIHKSYLNKHQSRADLRFGCWFILDWQLRNSQLAATDRDNDDPGSDCLDYPCCVPRRNRTVLHGSRKDRGRF